MQENFPKAEEICKIIATCRRAGVSSLKFGPLEVVFGARSAPVPAVLPQDAIQVAVPTPAAQDQGKPTPAQEQIEAESIEEQGLREREQRISELLIADPLLAEEMMELGDLKDGESEDGADEAFGE